MAAKRKAPQRGASRYQAPAKKPVPGWLWLVAGVAIGGVIMFLNQLEPGGKQVQRPSAVAKPAPAAKPKADEPAKPKYDFYTLLPESEVIVPPGAQPKVADKKPADAAAAEAKAGDDSKTAEPAAKPVQFYLQIGAFRSDAAADKLRAQLLLMGQDVHVESGKVREETWYRVLAGPYGNENELKAARTTLSANGFSNLQLQRR
ncbi:SPOR domain-containing protein [Atopomonas sediminilitoris]|uniref:SPOR domain-containing protein n=1 Tax=Atopomonas sediminilitoris TaxID=2919919 RepID=UPI001F4E8D13|nr:SPOR domain-containing protein [Atopomonas sediminilitoris]MCJ8169608.1 SPOR domain-containing protein [Atopomonas sediminilitoris]